MTLMAGQIDWYIYNGYIEYYLDQPMALGIDAYLIIS